ncbi:O-methyltransferase [Bacillus seohaeanensis]|jgi:predicted O-methyltransferase YrrM|uniref:tRNA 5-hydroxyuridine methyltransferase n=1 Tax=Bacillus seohaeanensis TaxID=284580 RepID=A0ABW5RRW1_9BACI
MNDEINQYIESLIPKRSSLLMEMEEYAVQHNVPIMELVGIETLLGTMNIQQPTNILEIGTAIGYSALRMAEALPKTNIVTIERETERFQQAKKFLSQSPDEKERIQLVFGDALEVVDEIREYGPYDAIFIDAAKGQYKKFFEIYTEMLTPNGIVYSDNVLFKGLVAQETIDQKRIRSMVKKLQSYNQWLMNHETFDTYILPVGDGIAISKRRGEVR